MSMRVRTIATIVFLVLIFACHPGVDRHHRPQGSLLHALLRGPSVDGECGRVAHILYRTHQYRPGRLRADGRLCLCHTGDAVWPLLLADLAHRWFLLRARQRADRLADLAVARRLFRHGDPRPHRSRAAPGAGAADYAGAKGITSIPLPGAIEIFGLSLVPDFAKLENPRIGFYYLSAVLMTAVLCSDVPAGEFTHRAYLHVAAAE